MKYALSILTALVLLAAPQFLTAQSAPPPDCPAVMAVEGDFDEPFPVFAQRPDGGGPGGPGWHDRMGKRKHLEQLRMLKLLEFLDLSEDQEIAFLTRFKAMRDTEQSIETQRRAKAEELAGAIENDKISDAEIDTMLEQLKAIMRSKIDMLESFMTDLKPILTSRQRARMLIFEDRFEVELLKRVNEFHRRRMGDDETPLEQPSNNDR
jgi:hypothetical protein